MENMINEEIISINLKRKDVYFIEFVLQDYSGMFKENSDTRIRIEKIVKYLEKQEEQ